MFFTSTDPSNTETTAGAPTSVSGATARAYQSATPVESLVAAHHHMVAQEAGRIAIGLPSHIDERDLRSEGLIGLIGAARKYRAGERLEFVAYARTRIRGAIIDHLRRLDWRSRTARQKAKTLQEAIRDVEQKQGRPAQDREIAQHLGLTAVQLEKWFHDSAPAVWLSLDVERNEEGGGAHIADQISDESTTLARDRIEREETLAIMRKCLATLTPTEQKILAMHHIEGMRLAEIGAALHLTPARICQINSRALLTLRARMSADIIS